MSTIESLSPPPGPRRLRLSPPPAVAKAVLVALVALGCLAGQGMIRGLIAEREARADAVRAEFAQSWGPEQALRGPVLVIPYLDPAGAPSSARGYLKVLPERTAATIHLDPEARRRGLFHATVYGARVELESRFRLPDADKIRAAREKGGLVMWDQAFVVMKAGALTGLDVDDAMYWNGLRRPLRDCWPAAAGPESCKPGLLVALAGIEAEPAPSSEAAFRAVLSLRGTEALTLSLPGREVQMRILAPWATPSFTGNLLPERAEIGPAGFDALWSAAYPETTVRASPTIDEAADAGRSTAGVALLAAMPTYRMVMRASKYNALFIALAFVVYGLVEAMGAVRVHPLQYALLGASLTLFPLLLLAVAEHTGFAAGYLTGATLILAQTLAYTRSVTKAWRATAAFGASLTLLFGFIYVLLGQETHALLMGALGLFLVLSAAMAVTQRLKPTTPGPAA